MNGQPSRAVRAGRWTVLARKGLGLGTALLLACGFTPSRVTKDMARNGTRAEALREEAKDGRLLARPHLPTAKAPEPGLHPLGLSGKRDGFLYVPAGLRANHPAPLVLMLHGAGGNARNALNPWLKLADEEGLLLLAPDSRGPTWDLIAEDGYGSDVAFIDRALAYVFDRYAVDPEHIAIEGFSDGASYALSLGLTNGDLFTHVVAFSPGFVAPAAQRGEPGLYISHGVKDAVLPIEPCSRRIVPLLQRAGYTVQYHEFDGPHSVPADIVREALDWFTAQ